MAKQVIRKIVYGTVALVLLLLCVVAYGQITKKEKIQVDILFLGDSLIGQFRDETSVPYLVGEKTGMTVFNGALGGTCATRTRSEEDEFFRMDGVSFAALSYALAEGDFRMPQATIIRQMTTGHFPEVIDTLERIDMDEVKYLVVEYGTNDYFGGRPVEDVGAVPEEYTFEGVYRKGLQRLKKAFPSVRIILLSPTYSWDVLTGENCETTEFGGGYLKEYVDVVAELAVECEVDYLDLYTNFYPQKEYEAAGVYTSDGIHPNSVGREMLAEAIADYIRSNEE